MDLISEREAARVLAAVGLSRRRSRVLLGAGFAGKPRRTASATLFDRELVKRVAARPLLTNRQRGLACVCGPFVSRRPFSILAPETEQRTALEPDWTFSMWTTVRLRAWIEEHGKVPFVATVVGFVGLGADIVGVHCTDRSGQRWRLELGRVVRLGSVIT